MSVPTASATVSTTTSRRVVRGLAGAGTRASSELRTATYDGRDYLVVPVVMMVGGTVIRPLGSVGPEYVPVHVLAAAPQGWNGRPAVMPSEMLALHVPGGGSANEPEILERAAFGHVFHAQLSDDGRLVAELWLSRAKAEAVGLDAVAAYDRCAAGETVEVSIGAYVGIEERAGITAAGQRYEYVWTDIAASDHLAVLPEGAVGACSVDGHGCGTNRTLRAAATRTTWQTMNGGQMATNKITVDVEAVGARALGQRLRQLAGQLLNPLDSRSAADANDGTSDQEIRTRVWDLLYAVEPGFAGIEDLIIHSETSFTVVYSTMPEREYLMWQRSVAVAEDGAVSLADDRQRVEVARTYQPVAAAASAGSATGSDGNGNGSGLTGTTDGHFSASDAVPALTSACSCGNKHGVTNGNENALSGGQVQASANADADTAAGGGSAPMSVSSPNTNTNPAADTAKADLIGRLVANTRAPFDESSRPALQALSEDGLRSLASQYESAPVTEQPVAQPITTASASAPADTVTISREDYADIRAAADAHKARQQAEKTALVRQLTSAQTAFTEADLSAKPVAELQKLAAALQINRPAPVADYSGRGLAVDPDETGPRGRALKQALNPPDPYGLDKAKAAAAGADGGTN